ncbi:MAG TPA: hypothetical protein DCQ93_05375 [Bacteroidetes bacterium]|nr:hypothetical protein [Bacteroidota bacterium]
MRKTIILFFIFSFSKILVAQNLVPNSGFDSYSVCPSGSSQVITPPWFVPTGQTGTPDYMNACYAGGQQGAPNNFYGFQVPQSPNGYYGMITYYGGGIEVREYLTAQLTTPLVAGQTYSVGVSVSYSDNFEYATDHFGVYISAAAPTWIGNYSAMNTYTPQVDNGAGNLITDMTNWTLISGTYTAVGGENFVTIGNFYNDANTLISVQNASGLMWGYYYVDDVFVIPTNPTLNVTGNTMLCLGESTTLTATGGGPYQWADSLNQNTILSTDSFLTVSPVSTTTYMTWNNSDTVYTTVHVNLPPVVNLGNDTSFCTGNSIVLNATTVGATYLWQDNSTGNTDFANSAGTYWCAVTLNGCTTTDSINISLLPLPVAPVLASNSPICEGGNLNLTSTFALGATIIWNGPNGWTSTQQNPVITSVTVANSGLYSASVTLNGCTSPVATINVVVNQAPAIPIAGSNSPVCEGGTLNLTAQGAAGALFSWTGPNGWTSLQQNPSIINSIPSQSGNYSVAASLNGCTSQPATISVIVVPASSLTFSVSPDTICKNQSTIVTLTSPIVPLAAYNLYSIPGTILSGSSPGPWTVQYDTAGDFNIIVDGIVGGCSIAPDTQMISVQPAPILSFSTMLTQFCDSALVLFTNNSSGYSSLSWNLGDGAISNDTNPTHTYLPGNYDVSISAVSQFGCSANFTQTNAVNVPFPVQAEFTATPGFQDSLELSSSNILFTNQSQNAVSYHWDFGDSSTSTFISGFHQYADTGSYYVTLIAIGMNGCADTVVHGPWIIVPPVFYFIPNAFTPNHDGLNDLFRVYGSGIESLNLKVFDRWGEMVFESNNIESGWDGSFKGFQLNTGVYVYCATIIFQNGKTEILKGDVSLLK